MKIPKPSTLLWQWDPVYQYLPQLLMSLCFEAMGDKTAALHWAKAELATAPPSQHPRISTRIKMLEQKTTT